MIDDIEMIEVRTDPPITVSERLHELAREIDRCVYEQGVDQGAMRRWTRELTRIAFTIERETSAAS